jgi:hypothetical protein
MPKPTSPTAEHRAVARPKVLKLYTYGNVEFVLHQGGQPPRRFDINWMKAAPSTNGGEPNPNGDANESYCRG